MGKKVRYDGGHKLDSSLISTLSASFELVPICPEYEAGLGVPREAMQLTGDPASPRLRAIATGEDHTDTLVEWSQIRAEEMAGDGICGVVLKARSPSCGLALVDVFGLEGGVVGDGPGLFVRALLKQLPGLPLAESEALHSPGAVAQFITLVEKFALTL